MTLFWAIFAKYEISRLLVNYFEGEGSICAMFMGGFSGSSKCVGSVKNTFGAICSNLSGGFHLQNRFFRGFSTVSFLYSNFVGRK